MNIRSAKVDQLVERLSRLTGEDVETAIERAVEERLSRVAPPAPAERKAALDAFFDRVSRLPVVDRVRQNRSSAMTATDCRPDGAGYVRDHRNHRE